jgi:PilZ domain
MVTDAVQPTLDQRTARRFALVLRAAKLVCVAGEFLCVLRDVSAGGVRVRLFHPVPPGERFRLELGSGAGYDMALVWQRDGYAGFSFCNGAIDASALIAEASPFPKRQVRLQIERPALVTFDLVRRCVMLCDISQQGARVDVQPRLPLGARVNLTAPGLPQRPARVHWRRKRAHGLVFEQAYRLDELAELVGGLQLDCEPGLAAAS